MRLILLPVIFLSLKVVSQQHLAFNQPPGTPAIFSKGVVSTGYYERDFAISPDNSEIFYTIQSPVGGFQTIVHRTKNKNGTWGKPSIASFAGKYRDLEPAFSPDGKRLFFSSNRPLQGTESKDVDIWFIEKINGKWGEPMNAGPIVNGPLDEYYPCVTANGNLYFTSAYDNSNRKEDIYVATSSDTGWTKPQPVDSAVNSSFYEFNAYVAPDESFIIFTSYGRKDDTGRGDLYISRKDKDNKWGPAMNLRMVNSSRLDYCPFVSADRKSFFFSSERNSLPPDYTANPISLGQLLSSWSEAGNGNSDIYWISFAELWKSLDK